MSDLSHPTLTVVAVPIGDLKADPENARQHSKRNIQAIAHSLSEFGQQKPLVVGADNVVVAGSGTLEAARILSWAAVYCVYTELTGAQAKAFAIADNRTAELAAWDVELLPAQIADLLEQDEAIIGFTEQELAAIMNAQPLPGETDPDAIPEPPDQALTNPGDLIVLGYHRLLCGDSASEADVDRLLGGAPIHLVNTDPPYNVKVEPRSNNAIAAGLSSFAAQGSKNATHKKMRSRDRSMANDFVSDEDFDRMLRVWFGNIARVLMPGRGFYIWGGYSNVSNYPSAIKGANLYLSQVIVWDKQHPVMTRKDFMGAHESCFYGWREGAAHVYLGPNNATDVWSVKKVNPNAMIHLTEKPVELAVRAMQYSSRAGENVLDLFGGSGSTLIAAEQTGRKAFLMEIDPPYCDVIVERWEEFTGQKAVRPVDGAAPSPVENGVSDDAENEERENPTDAVETEDVAEGVYPAMDG